MLISNVEECIGCELCVHQCPQNAVESRGNRVFFDAGNCTSCGTCAEMCGYEAISRVQKVNSKGCIECESRCYKRLCPQDALVPIPWLDIKKCAVTQQKIREMAQKGNRRAKLALDRAGVPVDDKGQSSNGLRCKPCWIYCEASESPGEPAITTDGKVCVAEKCIGCAFKCRTHCITNAIHIDVFITPSKCVSCGKCVIICPQNHVHGRFDWESLAAVSASADSVSSKSFTSLSPEYPQFPKEEGFILTCLSDGACRNQRKIRIDALTK